MLVFHALLKDLRLSKYGDCQRLATAKGGFFLCLFCVFDVSATCYGLLFLLSFIFAFRVFVDCLFVVVLFVSS